MLCSASPENEQSAHVIGHISLARHVRFRQLPSSKSKYETVCILKRTGSQAGGDFHSVEDLVHSPEVAECALASPSQRPKPSGQRCGGIRLRTQMRPLPVSVATACLQCGSGCALGDLCAEWRSKPTRSP